MALNTALFEDGAYRRRARRSDRRESRSTSALPLDLGPAPPPRRPLLSATLKSVALRRTAPRRRSSSTTPRSTGAPSFVNPVDRDLAPPSVRCSSTTSLPARDRRRVPSPRSAASAPVAATSFSIHQFDFGAALARHDVALRARRRGRRRDPQRPLPGRGQPPRRHPHAGRPRGAALRIARALQGRPRRQGAGASSTAGSSSITGAQKTDAKQTNRNLLLSKEALVEHQSAARDLRRRRQVHARLDRRSARRGRGLLPALARHRRAGGEEPPDLRLRQRRRRAGARRSRCATNSRATSSAGCRWATWSATRSDELTTMSVSRLAPLAPNTETPRRAVSISRRSAASFRRSARR